MVVNEAEGVNILLSASTIFFSSSTRCTPEDDSVLALDMRVLTTATLCVTGWCDAKERYWLVLGVGGIPVWSGIMVLYCYRSGIYLYVCHTGNRIPITP